MDNVNKIPNQPLIVMGDTNFRITITDEDTGKVLYSNPSRGGVFCSVEDMQVLKASGEVEGRQQHLFWGKSVAIVHAFLMLQKQIEQQIQQNPIWRDEINKTFL